MAAPQKLQTTTVPVAQLRLNDTVSPSPFSVKAIAFTADNRTMAVSGNRSPDIFIYRQNIDAGMVLVDKLKAHTEIVCDLDWSKHNQLVSCSHDRNVLVWTEIEDNCFQGTLVESLILRSEKGNTVARWSTIGNKFVVGTLDNQVFTVTWSNGDWTVRRVPFYDTKKLGNLPVLDFAITALTWVGGLMLCVGGCDGSVTVVAAPSIDDPEDKMLIDKFEEKHKHTTGKKLPKFGKVVMDINVSEDAWVSAVAASQCGCYICICQMDSTVLFFDVSSKIATEVHWSALPFSCCAFLSSSVAVAAGWNEEPVMFVKQLSRVKNEPDQWFAYSRLLPGKLLDQPFLKLTFEYNELENWKIGPKEQGSSKAGGGGVGGEQGRRASLGDDRREYQTSRKLSQEFKSEFEDDKGSGERRRRLSAEGGDGFIQAKKKRKSEEIRGGIGGMGGTIGRTSLGGSGMSGGTTTGRTSLGGSGGLQDHPLFRKQANKLEVDDGSTGMAGQVPRDARTAAPLAPNAWMLRNKNASRQGGGQGGGAVDMIDIDGAERAVELKGKPHTDQITVIRQTVAGKTFTTAGVDGRIIQWDLSDIITGK